MCDEHDGSSQTGAALLVFIVALVLASAALLLERAQVEGRTGTADGEATGLAQARAALIAWAVTYPPRADNQTTPGLLPFPDRRRDGNYDGHSDCVAPAQVRAGHLLGRFPRAGHTAGSGPCTSAPLYVDLDDASGEPLWYAVSRNLIKGAGGGPINPDMFDPARVRYPWLRVVGADGEALGDPRTGEPLAVAAVVIAPGPALPGQERGEAAAPEEFLDRITIGGRRYDNADADDCADDVSAPCAGALAGEEFVHVSDPPPGVLFNDRLVYITVDELMRAVERRVLGEVDLSLKAYREREGPFPWLAPFRDPRSVLPTFRAEAGVALGLLPVHLPEEIFRTAFTARWRFVDGTPRLSGEARGATALMPPVADVVIGELEVPEQRGRCLWESPARATCAGSVELDHYRPDLGLPVRRRIEVSFSITGEVGVQPATAADVRRRTVSANALDVDFLDVPVAVPLTPTASWSVRITDASGSSWGRRELAIDDDTRGQIALADIAFDLSVVYDDEDTAADELPEWLVENGWHELVHVALSIQAVPGGTGACVTGTDCLSLLAGSRLAFDDVNAMLVAAGAEWVDQDRGNGDCDGDGNPDESDGFPCAYLEGENRGGDPGLFARAPASYGYGPPPALPFNDQVRVMDPPPPPLPP